MDNSSSNGWFGSLKKKMTNLYNTAKGTPVETTPILGNTIRSTASGGSKKKRSKKHRKSIKRNGSKKVRFSKKHKVYTVRRYKK
jgi:hypothetical protein